MAVSTSWFVERTSAAPHRLSMRAAEVFEATDSNADLATRLAAAGSQALDAAAAAGTGRGAALDLLAADALITLALIATSEERPQDLRSVARSFRLGADV